MKNVVFGAACMGSGLLLAQMMLFIGAYPNAFDSLTFFGKLLVWSDVAAAVLGLFICLSQLLSED